MCSEYHTPQNPEDIEAALGIDIINKAAQFEWGGKMNFFKQGPVLQRTGERFEMVLKTFPTSPMPNSRLSGLEGQSEGSDVKVDGKECDETQIKRIYEMKLWKDGFKDHPLLIPMSSFTEFAYWGPEIGTAQSFRITEEKLFFAAGIAIKPFTPKGPAFSGYSILTHTATEQMLHYHHRLIVLLNEKAALGYLEEMSSEERFNYLIENRYTGSLRVEKIRNMAKGWEKRADAQAKKLNRELLYRDVLAKEHIEG